MKIVCDTNIWYGLGQDQLLFDKVKDEPLAPNYINIQEMSTTYNAAYSEDILRAAIQKIFHFKNNMIYEPPFIYLAKLNNSFDYDIIGNTGVFLEFNRQFALGEKIKEDKIQEFEKFAESKKQDLQKACDFFNERTDFFRSTLTNKKAFKQKSILGDVSHLVNYFVEWATNKEYNLEGFDLNNIELLIRTMEVLFKKMVVAELKMQPNDWNDLVILSYVQPGDKYWTNERKWKSFIKEAKMESYLFEPKN